MRALLLAYCAKSRDQVLKNLTGRFGCLRLESTSASSEEISDKLTQEYLISTRARIFGYRIGDGNRSGAKLLKRKLVLDKIKNYYPDPPQNIDPFFEDPKIEKQAI